MKWRHKVGRFFSHQITILVIPHPGFKARRLRCSVAFLFFCFSMWMGLTLWAGLLAGEKVDYWVTKADNQLMKVKLVGLAREVARSEDTLAMVQSSDREMHRLLGLKIPDSNDDSDVGTGGPTFADQRLLRDTLYARPADIRPRDWHKEIEAIRKESYKRLANFQEIAWYISNQRSLYRSTPTTWPTDGQITSPFGYRFDPITGSDDERNEFHSGVDIANRPDTLIHATADGTVRLAGWSHGYGMMVLIDHGYGFSTLYGHLSKFLVRTGDHISRGQVIAYMGTTGRSTGAHLHYEVWTNGKPVNPMQYLKVHSVTRSSDDGQPSEDAQKWGG